MGYVYGLVCPLIDEVRYVGITTTSLYERRRGHLNKFKKNLEGKKAHKEAWFKSLYSKNLLDDIKIITIEECDNDNLYEREKFWIEKYRNDGYKLTNLKDGGYRPSGYKVGAMSKEARENISKGLKEFWKDYKGSDADKLRISKIIKTRKEKYGDDYNIYSLLTDDAKKKRNILISEAAKGEGNSFYGKKHSDESKQKMSENSNNKGENNPFYGKNHNEETKKQIADKLINKLVKPLLVIDNNGKIINYFTEVDKLLSFTNTKDCTGVSRRANKNISLKGYFYYHITDNFYNLYKNNFNRCVKEDNYDFIIENNLDLLR